MKPILLILDSSSMIPYYVVPGDLNRGGTGRRSCYFCLVPDIVTHPPFSLPTYIFSFLFWQPFGPVFLSGPQLCSRVEPREGGREEKGRKRQCGRKMAISLPLYIQKTPKSGHCGGRAGEGKPMGARKGKSRSAT